MFIKIILIILTIIAYTVFITPAYFEMQENIKGLEYKNTISESSNHILRKENEILKRKINKLETEKANILKQKGWWHMSTAVIITAIICTTIIALEIINHGGGKDDNK